MKGKDNNEIIQATEIALADKYKAEYRKRKSSITIKDTVKFELPNKQIIKLFFRNGKLVSGESKDLSETEVQKIINFLKVK